MGVLKKLFGRRKDAPPPAPSPAPASSQSDPRTLPGNVPYRPVMASDPSQWLQHSDFAVRGPQLRSVSTEDMSTLGQTLHNGFSQAPGNGTAQGVSVQHAQVAKHSVNSKVMRYDLSLMQAGHVHGASHHEGSAAQPEAPTRPYSDYKWEGAATTSVVGGGGARGGEGVSVGRSQPSHAVLKVENDRWGGGRLQQSQSSNELFAGVPRHTPPAMAQYQEIGSTVVCNIGELDAASNMVSQLKLRANQGAAGKVGTWTRERTRRESWPAKLSDLSEELGTTAAVMRSPSGIEEESMFVALGHEEPLSLQRLPSQQVQALQLEGLELDSLESPSMKSPTVASGYPEPPTDPYGPEAAPLGARSHSHADPFVSPPPTTLAPPNLDYHALSSQYQASPPPHQHYAVSQPPLDMAQPSQPPAQDYHHSDPHVGQYKPSEPPHMGQYQQSEPPHVGQYHPSEPSYVTQYHPSAPPEEEYHAWQPADSPTSGAQAGPGEGEGYLNAAGAGAGAGAVEAVAGGEAPLDVAGALMSGTLAKLHKKKKDWEDTFAVLSCKSQVNHAAGADIAFAYVLELFPDRNAAATGAEAQDLIHVSGAGVKFVQGTVLTIKTTGELNKKGLTHFMSANTTAETRAWLSAFELVPDVTVNWVGNDGTELDR